MLQTGEYDYAWNLQVEDDILKRLEQGGKGRAVPSLGGNMEFIAINMMDPNKEVDGERSSLKALHPFFSDPAVRQALTLLVDRAAVQEHIYGRTGIQTANFLNAPSRFQSKNTRWEFNIDKANQVLDAAGSRKRGADGTRVKDGVKLKLVFATSINAPRQKAQAIVKQACAKAGLDVELKSVVASGFLLIRSGESRYLSPFLHRYPDVHDHPDAAGPRELHEPVRLVGGGDQGQQMAGTKHHAMAQRGVRSALSRRRN